MSDGSRSGVHCTPPEPETRGPGEPAGGQGLAQSGHVLEQHVTAGEDPSQHEAQRLVLADDGEADPRQDIAGHAGAFVDR